MTATFYVGDAVTVMNTLPEKSVDLILTSPPFLALRSYLPSDHPDKALEGGSQATPGEYIDWLLDVVEACARVLARHGSLCFELGDTYSGSGGGGGDYLEGGWREGQQQFAGSAASMKESNAAHWRQKNQRTVASREHRPEREGTGADGGDRVVPASGGAGWPLAKSLSLIPETFRFAMVYGHNPFTGRTTPPWRLRNVIRWVRPNPPVGALGDKFRPATSELMVFCKAKDRFFDLDAVREPAKGGEIDAKRTAHAVGADGFGQPPRWTGTTATEDGHRINSNPAGAPPLDWWNIPSDAQVRTLNYVECGCTESCMTDEAVDQFRPATSELLVFCKSKTRFFDLDAVREPSVREPRPWELTGKPQGKHAHEEGQPRTAPDWGGTSPPLDWWNIPPGGYDGAHYAVFPKELLVKPIKAMCPEKVCRRCGEASRRITEVNYEPMTAGGRVRTSDSATMQDPESRQLEPRAVASVNSGHNPSAQTMAFGRAVKTVNTLGFTDCGHNNYRPGLVLDPFAGSGTTLAVATGHGRDAIGIDLDERNYELALDRVGPLILERGTEPARRINS